MAQQLIARPVFGVLRVLLSFAFLLFVSDAKYLLTTTPQRKTEILKGAEAEKYFQGRLRDPNRRAKYEKNVQALRARGFIPTDHYVVQRDVLDVLPVQHLTTRVIGRVSNWIAPTAFASTYAYDSDGSIEFWSWDDGDPLTWEGVFAAENFGSGEYASTDLQIDASNGYVLIPAPPPNAWQQETLNCMLFQCGYLNVQCAYSGWGWPDCMVAFCLVGAQITCALWSAYHNHVFQRAP